jgi:hypothetical protein
MKNERGGVSFVVANTKKGIRLMKKDTAIELKKPETQTEDPLAELLEMER